MTRRTSPKDSKDSDREPIESFLGKIRCGDAYDLLKKLPQASVDLLITSPPFWGHREYGLEHNWGLFNDIEVVKKRFNSKSNGYRDYQALGGVLGLEPYPEWYIEHLADIFHLASTVLKPFGSMWVNLGDTYFARWSSIRDSGRQGLAGDTRHRRKTPMGDFRQEKQLLLIPARFAIAMQQLGWILRNDLIWFKPNATPAADGDRLRLTHEHFFHFVKRPKDGRPKYYYDTKAVEPGLFDVVSVNAAAGENGHTATFPKKLITPRILSSCPPGGVVLDPFCGTGRVLQVAKESGRLFIGFDKFPGYCETAQSALDKKSAAPQQEILF